MRAEARLEEQLLSGRGRTIVPNIDYRLCQGCGGCAEAFPQFFEMRDEKAWVIHADKFAVKDQEGILLICPYYAITLE